MVTSAYALTAGAHALSLTRPRIASKRARAQRWRERNRDRHRATSRAWWHRNLERAREDSRDRYRANPAIFKARARAYKKAHPELARADRRKRYLGRNRDAYRYALELLKDPCAYCGGRAGQVDHIVSLAAGGDNSLENLTAACRSCNSEKRDNPLLIFLLKRCKRTTGA